MDNENTTAAVVEHAASDLSARKTETGPWWMRSLTLQEATTMIQSNMRQAARSIIAAGFYLKRVRDLELYRDDGLDSVWEYAGKQFGFSKTAASRYMAINDRFSVDGNSPVIRDDFKDFSRSQLQEMLYLTDQQLSEVTEDTTVRELRRMRQPDPKPEPVVNIPGQMDISDFGIEVVEGECIPAATVAAMSVKPTECESISEPESVSATELPQQEEGLYITADDLVDLVYEVPTDMRFYGDDAVAMSQQHYGWRLASDPPGCPGPTLVILRRNSKVLHDEEFNAGHRTDIVDYGDHYLEIAKRWFNGNMWAGFGETVIMWQWLPEFPAELLFEDMEEG